MRTIQDGVCRALSLALLCACGKHARLPVTAGMGPHPVLPAPQSSLIPTINVVKAIGWTSGARPVAGVGLRVAAFATDLSHPRWLHVLPNGDVLVAETNGPPSVTKGLRAWFFKHYQKKAGGAVPSANRITLLRDVDGDGIVDVRRVLLHDLASPLGMALTGSTLYVANTNAVVAYPYVEGDTAITAASRVVLELPAGAVNRHWTRNIIVSLDGERMYIAVGSGSNIGEGGMEHEQGRAAIWELILATGVSRVLATGLRNPVGMAWEPSTGALWTVVNERDELGGDLVPDYLTAVRDGAFYGWPWSYYGPHVDSRVKPRHPEDVARAVMPDYALGSHTASLGLAWAAGSELPPPFREGMFVGQHGSWNRTPRSGYKVIFVPFSRGNPSGDAIDVLTGFVNAQGEAGGRPVGVAIDRRGALLVADDVGNTVWRLTAR